MTVLPGVHAEPPFTPCASSYNPAPLLPCVCLVWGWVSVLVSCLVPLFPSENGTLPWIPADLVWLTSPLLRDWIVAHLSSHSRLQIPRVCLEERSWRGLIVSRSSLSSPCLTFIYYWGDDNDLVNGWKNALSLFSLSSSIVYSLPLQSAFLRLILTNSLHLSVAKVLSLLEVLRLRFLLGAHLSDQFSHT